MLPTAFFWCAGARDGAVAAQVIQEYFAGASLTSSTDHHSGTGGGSCRPAVQQLSDLVRLKSHPGRFTTGKLPQERSPVTALLEASDLRGRQVSWRSAASPWLLAHTAAGSWARLSKFCATCIERSPRRCPRAHLQRTHAGVQRSTCLTLPSAVLSCG